MLGLGAGDMWWVGASAFVAGMAGALALAVRAGFRKAAIKGREAFVDWFGAAIDTHVAPKFDAIRVELHASAEATQENSRQAAAIIKQEALDTAAKVRAELLSTAEEVKQQLQQHADEEMPLVRDVVQQEVAPLAATLDARTPLFEQLEQTMNETRQVLREHMDHDERLRAEDGQRLVAGQAGLKGTLDSHHAEAMGKHAALDQKVDALDETVKDHIEADVENFARNDASFARIEGLLEEQ